MAVHYRTQGFVLKKEDFREADQIFSIYTKDFGKLEVLGRAIRKIKSKLRPGADIFYLSEIEFIQGKNYKTLTDATVINKFPEIRKDLNKLEIAYQITENANELIRGEEKDEAVFNLLNEVFNKLNNWKIENSLNPVFSQKSGGKLKIICHYFIWNLLSILGYQIDLYHCVKCQKKLNPGIMNFSPRNNGIVCFRCSNGALKDKILITSETIKILRLFLKNNWNILSRLKIDQELKEPLEKFSRIYFSHIQT
ncbi:MAG: DNA repair protein RecO [Candidatus Nealsonbacteria bacterium]|nr:DNA repair protein RecO [Candidatus Nealsonbacteria bacterium]